MVLVVGAGFYFPEKKLALAHAVLMIFFGVGLFLFRMVARSASAHQRSVYAVTDQRAIVAEFGSDITIRTFFPKRLHDVWRVRGKDGLESVVLRTDLTLQGDDVRKESAGFLDMEDADDAVNAYRRLRDGGTPESRA